MLCCRQLTTIYFYTLIRVHLIYLDHLMRLIIIHEPKDEGTEEKERETKSVDNENGEGEKKKKNQKGTEVIVFSLC